MAWGSKNKYHAQGTRDDSGNFFPSKGEAGRARDLQLQQKAGLIRELKFHPSIEIFPGLNWKLDSSYVQANDGITYYEDFKGLMTREVQIKIKIWEYLGPGPLRISRGDYRKSRFFVDKEYRPKGVAQFLKDFGPCSTT